MISQKRERFWYSLSQKLGLEIALYGVGDWVHFPAQTSNSGAHFGVDEGEMAPWMVRAIDRTEMPWWFHTHPDMPAFFSRGTSEFNDLRGAHDLWDMIRRPFKAIIRGNKNQRLEMTIDSRWIKKNQAPPPWVPPPPPQIVPYQSFVPNSGAGHPQYPHNGQLPASYTPPYGVSSGLDNEVAYLVQKYGARNVYETLDQLVYVTYTDRQTKIINGVAAW